MAFQQISITTNAGREARAMELVNGEPAVQIVGFAVGESGSDPGDPTTALAPDPTATALGAQIFPSSGYHPYDAVEWVNSFTPVFVCKLELSEAIGALAEIGLFAQYVTGPNAGDVFLYCITHTPLSVKSSSSSPTYRIALPH